MGAGVFDFFGTNLFYVNAGSKRQEPLQFGIRTAIEEGVIDLVAEQLGLNPKVCLGDPKKVFAQRQPVKAAVPAPAAASAPMAAAPINAAADAGIGPDGMVKVPFDFTSADIVPQAASLIDRIAGAVAQKRSVRVELIAHDTERLDPESRLGLSKLRVMALQQALQGKGIAPTRVHTDWLPDPTNAAIRHDGAGYEVVAILTVK